MNWDSFVPDLLVGLSTGGVVGLVVIGAERRISERAHRRVVEDAQSKAVDRGRSLVQHRVRFQTTPDKMLHLDMAQYDRLRDVISAVPSGEPRKQVPGYFLLAEASALADDVEALADGLDARISDYEAENPRDMNTTKWMRRTIVELAALKPSRREKPWEWQWDRNVHPTYGLRVAYDSELTATVNTYLAKADLLSAHREAFLEADQIWRHSSRIAYIASPFRKRPTLFEILMRPLKRHRILTEGRREADEAAGAILKAALAK